MDGSRRLVEGRLVVVVESLVGHSEKASLQRVVGE
jgi:hypothetical protein